MCHVDSVSPPWDKVAGEGKFINWCIIKLCIVGGKNTCTRSKPHKTNYHHSQGPIHDTEKEKKKKSCSCSHNISFVNSKIKKSCESVWVCVCVNWRAVIVFFVLVNWHLEIPAPC